MNVKLVVISLVVCIVLAGIANADTEKRKTITITDLAGRQVTVKVPVERVVLVSARYIHEFAAVEGEDFLKKIVGLGSDLKMYDKDTYDKYVEKFPEIENIPNVGYPYKGTFSAEKVISLQPDIVIFPLWMADSESVKEDIKRLEEAGILSIFIDFWKEPLENPVKSISILGTILGKEKRSQEVINFCKEHIDRVLSRLEKINKTKPKVYVECGWRGAKEYGTTYGNVGWGALVKLCGGINIAEGKIKKWGSINPEYLLATNPDIIIISAASYWPVRPDTLRFGYYADPEETRSLLELYTKRPGWENLNAVKNKRVYGIFHGFSFRVYNFVAIEALAKWFYPEEFKDINPEESFKEFHERFMPVDYSGVWLISLEGR